MIHVQEIHIPIHDHDHDRDNGRGLVEIDWNIWKNNNVRFHDYKALSYVRTKPTWVEPHLYPKLLNHSALHSQLLLLKSPDWKTTLAIYPIAIPGVNHHLRIEQGVIYSEYHFAHRKGHGQGEKETIWVVCVQADNRSEERNIIETVVDKARQLVGSSQENPRPREQSEAIWDGLGICTWESFLQPDGKRARPTLDLLLSLVPSFPIKTFLIDDGWQDIVHTPTPSNQGGNDHHRPRLNSFSAYSGLNPSSSSETALKGVVSALKEKGVEKVGVWMTLQGYWWGIDPNSKLCDKYQCVPYDMGRFDWKTGKSVDTGKQEKMWLPSIELAGSFWRDWFGSLKEAGVDFVKVDNQEFYDKPLSSDILDIQHALWKGMLEAVVHTWGSLDRVIMCMSHGELMLNGPGGLDFSRRSGRLIFRNSDDFALQYPRAHTDHIYNNLYNSILTSQLSLISDYDMFSSSSSQLPIYHGLLRSLTPGPLLISDTPSTTTDHDILARLTAKGKDGSVRAVKMDKAAQVLSRRWFWDNLREGNDGPALVGGSNSHLAGLGMLGIWNVHDPSADQSVARDNIIFEDVQDLLGLEDDDSDEYLLFPLNLDGGERRPMIVRSKCQSGIGMEVTLQKHTCEGVVVSRFVQMNNGIKVAVVGLLDKFAPLAGIKIINIENNQLTVESQFASELAIVIISDDQPNIQVIIDGGAVSSLLKSVRMTDNGVKAWLVSTSLDFVADGVGNGDKGSGDGDGVWRVVYVF